MIASWQAVDTGVTNHDAAMWSPHIADEFTMLGSSNDHPLTKADRIATLNLQKQTRFGSAPAPLVSAQMFDFGDSVVMTCLHQPYTGKPVHVTRLWIKRDVKWILSISYQTTIQAAPAKIFYRRRPPSPPGRDFPPLPLRRTVPPAPLHGPGALRRFRQEGPAAACMSHPTVLAIYYVGEHDGMPYIVSELVEGESLRGRLHAGTLPVRKSMDCALQIADGL